MNTETVELHFIDGPLQGTRKRELFEYLLRSRTYRHLEPLKGRATHEQKVPNTTGSPWIMITCVEYNYISIPLPDSSGTKRFAMCLDMGL